MLKVPILWLLHLGFFLDPVKQKEKVNFRKEFYTKTNYILEKNYTLASAKCTINF